MELPQNHSSSIFGSPELLMRLQLEVKVSSFLLMPFKCQIQFKIEYIKIEKNGKMAFITASFRYSDFLRFSYGKLLWNSDFFEQTFIIIAHFARIKTNWAFLSKASVASYVYFRIILVFLGWNASKFFFLRHKMIQNSDFFF